MSTGDKGGLVREPDGRYAIVTHDCPECGEPFMFRDAHVKTSPRHRQWLNGELQPEVPVPEQPPGLTYNASNVPTRITFGVSALCPRCKGVVKVSRKTKARDTRSRDPYRPEKVCPRCDGWGIVPNQSV